jgi:hypothetical protein
MQSLAVDTLTFSFPDGWHIGKPDEWAYYRKQFSRMWKSIKSLDLLAVAPDRTTWLIEAKDYRQHARTKPSSLGEEIAHKVIDTLASLLPAKVNASDAAERALAKACCGASRLRVVLHLEQPAKHSKLFPRAIDPVNVQMKLRQLLKPIDAHPLVVEMQQMHGLAWTVS